MSSTEKKSSHRNSHRHRSRSASQQGKRKDNTPLENSTKETSNLKSAMAIKTTSKPNSASSKASKGKKKSRGSLNKGVKKHGKAKAETHQKISKDQYCEISHLAQAAVVSTKNKTRQKDRLQNKSNKKKNTKESQHFKVEKPIDAESRCVKNAILEGNTFEIRGSSISGSNAVRDELVQRGWFEKLKQQKNKNQGQGQSQEDTKSNLSIPVPPLKKWMKHHASNLIWTDYGHRISWSKTIRGQLINKFPGSFVSKQSLVEISQNLQWVENSSYPFPRSYRLFIEEEKIAFIQDFRLTACLSLLKLFIKCVDNLSNRNSSSKHLQRDPQKSRKLVISLLDFALAQIRNYSRIRRHQDIDDECNNENEQKKVIDSNGNYNNNNNINEVVVKMDWDLFLNECSQLLNHGSSQMESAITPKEDSVIENLRLSFSYDDAKMALKDVRGFWPQFHIDGARNAWIFKPEGGTCGQQIKVLNKYEDISQLFLIENSSNQKSKSKSELDQLWIAQKYIETPLLIFKVKFDVRQWFLVSSYFPLIAWFYKQSYLRFSRKLFTLDDLRPCIHLTNNEVQNRYLIDPVRNTSLPKDNMWTCSNFQTHLKKIGQPAVWNNLIYPGMKKAVLSVLLATRDSAIHRDGSFQIYGADFVLCDNFHPFLIEINSCPILSNTSNVKSKLAPKLIQDTMKVILDWNCETTSSNNDVDTGDFELLYNEQATFPNSCFSETSSMCRKFIVHGEKLPILNLKDDLDYNNNNNAQNK